MYQYGNLTPILTDDYTHSVCFGVTQEDHTLSSILSKTLNTITDDEMEQLIIGAQAARPEASSPQALIHNYPVQSLILLTALAGLLAALTSLLVFARRTSRQNLALKRANAAKTDFLSRMSQSQISKTTGCNLRFRDRIVAGGGWLHVSVERHQMDPSILGDGKSV